MEDSRSDLDLDHAVAAADYRREREKDLFDGKRRSDHHRRFERVFSLARVAVLTALFVTLGVAGVGIFLVAEGLSRSNNTATALGVLCMIVALMASTAGAWKLSGVGFQIEKGDPIAALQSSSNEVRSLDSPSEASSGVHSGRAPPNLSAAAVERLDR